MRMQGWNRFFYMPEGAPAWSGGAQSSRQGPESDEPSGEREATEAELREAAEKSLDHSGGERGDLGDSGPGED